MKTENVVAEILLTLVLLILIMFFSMFFPPIIPFVLTAFVCLVIIVRTNQIIRRLDEMKFKNEELNKANASRLNDMYVRLIEIERNINNEDK